MSSSLPSPLLLEHNQLLEEDHGLIVEDAVFNPQDSKAQLVVSNLTGLTVTIEEGAILGEATAVNVVKADNSAMGLDRLT